MLATTLLGTFNGKNHRNVNCSVKCEEGQRCLKDGEGFGRQSAQLVEPYGNVYLPISLV